MNNNNNNSRIKLYNARVLNPDFSVSYGGICVEGSKIACVFDGSDETTTSVNANTFDREINCKGNLLIPSFKNAHTHSAMTFLRSRADDMPLSRWLNEQVFPQEEKLSAEHIHYFTKLAMLEYISGGTTAAFDMYFEADAVASAAKDIGFRVTMCGSANKFGTTPSKMVELYEKYRDYDEFVDYKLGFHAEYTNTIETLSAVAQASKHHKAPVYTHMSETKQEHEECIKRHGKTPSELFESLGLWENGGGAFHCVHVSNDDMNIMARNDIWAITNPCSNLKLASGVAPLTKLGEKGIEIALGTDGAASNNALSMFREMYCAVTLQKVAENDAAACPAYNALSWATKNSALAMGLYDCDDLSEGKKADIVMIDLNRPSMRPLNNVAKNLVYAGDTSAVKMTMINGKIVYENGEFLVGEDSVHIIEKCEQLMRDFD